MSAIEVGLGFGSNIGDKAAHIAEARAMLEREGIVSAIVMSSLYRTSPWGHVKDQDWFLNACGIGVTQLSPAELLVRCKSVERRLGRTATVRWGPRVIDIDLLFYGDLRLESPGLTLPHKELLRRAFVLIPLAEIAPKRTVGGQTVGHLAAAMASDDVARMPDKAPEHPDRESDA